MAQHIKRPLFTPQLLQEYKAQNSDAAHIQIDIHMLYIVGSQ